MSPDAEHPRREGEGAANRSGGDEFEPQSTRGGGDFYARIPEWLLTAEISHGAVRLYGILDRHANADHKCWPTRGTLAEAMGVTRSAVDRHLKQLVAVGAVTVTPQEDEAGDPTSNLYLLVARRALAGSRENGGTPKNAATSPHTRDEGGRDSEERGGRENAPHNESQGEREPGEGDATELAVALIGDDGPSNHPPPKRRDEMRLKIKRIIAKHGEQAVAEAIRNLPSGAYTYAREVLDDLDDALKEPPCPRCNGSGQLSSGYLCGCPATGRRAS